MDLRERILAEIAARPGVTVRSLSLKAGLSDSALHKFLTGQTKSLTTDNLEKIAAALGMSARELWFGGDRVSYIWDKIRQRDRERALRVLEGFIDKKDSA